MACKHKHILCEKSASQRTLSTWTWHTDNDRTQPWEVLHHRDSRQNEQDTLTVTKRNTTLRSLDHRDNYQHDHDTLTATKRNTTLRSLDHRDNYQHDHDTLTTTEHNPEKSFDSNKTEHNPERSGSHRTLSTWTWQQQNRTQPWEVWITQNTINMNMTATKQNTTLRGLDHTEHYHLSTWWQQNTTSPTHLPPFYHSLSLCLSLSLSPPPIL